jgi:crotonobetainyl-CoA:carnitine CoA-transferase CaiB-like acyl-CoA transferase
LQGVRILDLSSFIAGPLGPAFLADLGADVVKIEAPEGDGLRANRGFLAWNRGKRGLSLDLKRPEALEVLYRLVEGADVLIENMRPGVVERLGIDYETLRRRNPRLIYCSVTAFGSTGPDRHKPGFDPLLQARSGIERAQGGFQNPPVFLLTPITDNTCAMLNAVGIALALFERQRSGVGQRVQTSLLRAAAFLQADGLLDFEGRGPRPANDLGQYGPSALYRLYECQDGWLFLAACDKPARQRLAALLGLDIGPPDEDAEAGGAGDIALAAELAGRFAQLSVDSWLQRLREAGIPAARAVEDYARTFANDPLLADAGLIISYSHPVYGQIRQPGVLARFGAVPASATRPASLIGQHSREVLSEAGYSSAEIHDLLLSGAVTETAPGPI